MAVYGVLALGLKFVFGLGLVKLMMMGACLLSYWMFGFLLPQKHLRGLDLTRYLVTMSLVLMMMGVLLKIGLRLGFDVKYVLSLPQFNLNI